MGDKVAIVGTVPNSRARVPWDDPSWDIWVCSPGNMNACKRVTEWFELHALVDCRAPENQAWWPNYIAWLRQQTFPVWMQEPNEEIPRAQIFPRRQLTNEFGPNASKTNWFTSSPAWMCGFAIQRGYKTIGVFGVDMCTNDEQYTGQRAGLLRWFEIMKERGIKVVIPMESTLPYPYPLYGYAEASRFGRSTLIREMETAERIKFAEKQLADIQCQLHYLRGNFDVIAFDRKNVVSGLDDAEIDEETLAVSASAPPSYPDLPVGARGFEVTPPLAQRVQHVNIPAPEPSQFPGNPDAGLLSKKLRKLNGPPKEPEHGVSDS